MNKLTAIVVLVVSSAFAHAEQGDIQVMGYVAHVENYRLSMSVGLPDSFAAGGGPIDPEDWAEYEGRDEAVCSMRRMDDQPEDEIS
jgi:hypothetical protein